MTIYTGLFLVRPGDGKKCVYRSTHQLMSMLPYTVLSITLIYCGLLMEYFCMANRKRLDIDLP